MNTPTDLPSPYQPPTADLSQAAVLAPQRERSAAPKVFGILSIIFASIVLLSSALGLLATAASSVVKNMGSLAPDADKAAEVAAVVGPMAKLYQGIGILSLIMFGMSALLLAIGIGQLRYRAWAQRWSVYWGVAGLVCVALMVAISMLIVSPAYAEMLDSLSHLKPKGDGQAAMGGSMSGLGSIFGGAFAVMTVVFYAPYPALMLLFFTRDRVRASMTS